MSAPLRRHAALLSGAALLLLAACASPMPPAWKTMSVGRTEEYRRQALLGQDTFAALNYTEAARALRSAADLHSLVQLELNRQAVAVILGREVPPAPAAGPSEPTPAHAAYAAWLRGEHLDATRLAALPKHHQAAARALQDPAAPPSRRLAALRDIKDPFAALLATSLALRATPADASLRDLAIDLAGTQGWSAALRVNLEARLATLPADAPQAATLRARLALLPLPLPRETKTQETTQP